MAHVSHLQTSDRRRVHAAEASSSMTIEELLQPYADSDDPRFAAISGSHAHFGQGGYSDPISCEEAACDGHAEVRTDLGALVDVANACGWYVGEISESEGEWDVGLVGFGVNDGKRSWRHAATKEDALAQVIVAVMPL